MEQRERKAPVLHKWVPRQSLCLSACAVVDVKYVGLVCMDLKLIKPILQTGVWMLLHTTYQLTGKEQKPEFMNQTLSVMSLYLRVGLGHVCTWLSCALEQPCSVGLSGFFCLSDIPNFFLVLIIIPWEITEIEIVYFVWEQTNDCYLNPY